LKYMQYRPISEVRGCAQVWICVRHIELQLYLSLPVTHEPTKTCEARRLVPQELRDVVAACIAYRGPAGDGIRLGRARGESAPGSPQNVGPTVVLRFRMSEGLTQT
jgi:hypothetical protein